MEGESSKTYVFGNEGAGTLGAGFVPGMLGGLLSSGIGGFGGFGGNWGINNITDLFGLAIIASMFGWNNGGFGGFGSGSAGAGFLSNQLNNDAGRELIMNAIQGTDADIRALATATSTDFDTVKSGINSVNAAIASVAAQTGMSSLQVINAIQSGNAAIGRQLCECCCENRLLTTQQGYESRIATIEQTNSLGSAISGSSQRTIDAIADLKTTVVKEFCDARERDMQSEINTKNEIITTLKGQIDNAAQTAQIASLLAPIQAKVSEIESRQPNTVPVIYPNITAVNTTPYTGGFGAGFNPYGYGWGGTSYWG